MTKGALTRQLIIEKAAPIFNQRGYAGCSMNDLMEATGLEKGGLYRHFTSKEELAVEAFKFAMAKAVASRTRDLHNVTGAIPRLLHVVKSFVHTPSPVAGGCPLMNVAAGADAGCPGVRHEARRAIACWKSRLSTILTEGVSSGELRSDIVPEKTANTIISMLEGALVISRLEGSRQPMFDAQETLASLFETLGSGPTPEALAATSAKL